MSRSRNARRGKRAGRSCRQRGCPWCLSLNRRPLQEAAVRAEAAAETVTGAERWYDWEGGFLECG